MATQIKTAALDARDGWMIYQSRYRPMLRYWRFIGALINCLGLNRNTKRVVCHGPLKYGGLAIMDVATEQISSRMHLLVSNIRKGNLTGRAMINAMSMYQMHLGCEKCFLDLDPEHYPTVPTWTMSCQYLWEELRAMDGSISIPDVWTPTSNRINDECIMDVFVRTLLARKGTRSCIAMTDIYQANACRLYLKVTWVSNISASGGNRIAPWAYTGSGQRQTSLMYPHQEKPSESAWKV